MDRYNSCEAHVLNSLCKRISFHINCIVRARRFLPRVTLQSVVTALVLSNLDYCNTMLSGATAAFSVQGPVLWNRLPHDIKTANSVNIFKKKLKTHFFRIYFT